MSAMAASPNIINGKTPDDIDESPCSESELFAYVEKAKKSISSKWQPVKGFEDRNAVAIFTVRQNGSIEDSKIIESSGSQAVDKSALDALKAASPLDSLPKGAPESIQIRYVFSWHVTHKYDRTPTPAEITDPKK
jgi:TonB family protein